jgi:hypothetical protein
MNRSKPDSIGEHRVRIGAGEMAWLKETWTRQWQREPTRDELRSLVTDYLREELMAREARSMGLEENDTIVRRRLAQKLEFLVRDTVRLEEPTEEDLRKFYLANPGRFQRQPRISFTHVFFNRGQHADLAADTKTALRQLTDGSADASAMGDRSLLELEIRDADSGAVAAQFGKNFADAVFALTPGAWSGPVESAYGLHLVRVEALTPGRLRDFEEVKPQLMERWRDDRQRGENEKYFAGLLRKYEVVLEDDVEQLVGPWDGGKEPGR